MRILLPAALVIAAAAPAQAATRSFTVTGYDKVRITGPFKVDLRTGAGSSARAEGSTAALNRVKLEVQGYTLVVSLDRTYAGLTNVAEPPVRIALATPSLAAASVVGGGSLTIDTIKARRFNLTVSGSDDAAIGSLVADQAVIAVSGDARATIAGKVGAVRASVNGSGAIEAAGLDVADLDLALTGSGSARLAASHTAKLFTTGSGGATVTGRAVCTVKAQGTGDVHCGKDAR